MSSKKQKNKKNKPQKVKYNQASIDASKSALENLKKVPMSAYIFSLIFFSFYTVFASAGITLRISANTVSTQNFWMLIFAATFLSILPVLFWKYRIISIISLAIAITLGISTIFVTTSKIGILSDDLYFTEFGSLILAVFFFIRVYKKLPELIINVKTTKPKSK